MKKNIIVVILLIVLCIICFIPFEKKNKDSYEISENYMETELYSNVLKVKKCNYETHEILFQDLYENEYSFHYEYEDICEGEFYSCIMYKNKTPEVYDDIILNACYIRFDLWEEYENKCKNFTGPMGYEMQYIRNISETEMEYRDEQTGIHYIVSNDFTIKNPIYKNSKLECLKTN